MKKLALYVFIDAFGYEIYKQHPYFLKDIATDAKPLQSVLGFTNTCLPSILSGKYPQEHGQASLFYYSDHSPFKWMKVLSFLPSFFDRFRVRNILSRALKKAYGYTGYFQLYSIPFDKLGYFDFTEKRDYFVPGAPFDTIFDYCVQNSIPYHASDWREPEERNLQAVTESIEEGDTAFAWLYLPSLDGILHKYGTQSPKVEEKIRWLDREIRNVYDKARKKYDDVALYVFSDHGMEDVTEGYDLIADIDALGLEYGKDYIAMYDSSMARFWFKNNKAREMITRKLHEIDNGSILDEEELRRLKTFFEDGKFGDLFFMMNPGIMINPSYFGKDLIAGMHGYHPDTPSSKALLISNKKIGEEITSITDIRKTMEKELAQ
ncbi:alkaline phosphatase family protein [Sulfurovum sp. ST-21]|uniref:Alkaline phosphatase family protein n=1 Tax=Sulfurovum indicum TaxID=2779528 RepID=A0A7M1S444_9BACT|nr:alkaline phosphatase family protein [Sulfurovum indicum]QOR61954.1 alkaline phosphatase family protein [Sulfurovum indicum]